MGKKGGGDSEAKQARADEQQRQDQIRAGTSDINSTLDSQFTPDYYSGLRQNYIDYADPQLESQYKDARDQLTYSLARSGTLDSSTRAQQEAKLQQLYDTNTKQIADTAESQANTAKSRRRAPTLAPTLTRPATPRARPTKPSRRLRCCRSRPPTRR